MKKLLEVREFEHISCNPDFKTEYAYLPESVFRDFEEFIHAFAGDEEHADALEFLKIGYRRNVGDIISVSNYVGLIQMQNGYQIQVLPKIDFGTVGVGFKTVNPAIIKAKVNSNVRRDDVFENKVLLTSNYKGFNLSKPSTSKTIVYEILPLTGMQTDLSLSMGTDLFDNLMTLETVLFLVNFNIQDVSKK